VVLVDIVLEPERAGVERIRSFMLGNSSGFASLEEAADAVAAYNLHRPRPKDPSGLLKNLRRRADGRYYWHWDPKVVRREPDGMMAERTQLAEGLRTVDVPVLLVRGAASDVVSAAGVTRFRDVMPHAEVFDVAAAGHMVAGDSNDAFSGAMLEFLTRRFPVTR
jgi:non-heme chloroperoxidase